MGYIKKRPGDKGRVVFEDAGGNMEPGSLDLLLNTIWSAKQRQSDRAYRKAKNKKRNQQRGER
jgi:hypothetical protein